MPDYDFEKFTEDSSDDYPKYADRAEEEEQCQTIEKLMTILNDKPMIIRYEKMLDKLEHWVDYLTKEGPAGVDQIETWMKESYK